MRWPAAPIAPASMPSSPRASQTALTASPPRSASTSRSNEPPLALFAASAARRFPCCHASRTDASGADASLASGASEA